VALESRTNGHATQTPAQRNNPEWFSLWGKSKRFLARASTLPNVRHAPGAVDVDTQPGRSSRRVSKVCRLPAAPP
jgi:hypothetical protein